MLEDSAWKIKEDSGLILPPEHIKLDAVEDHFKDTGLVPIVEEPYRQSINDRQNPLEENFGKHFYLYDPVKKTVPYSLSYRINSSPNPYKTYVNSIAMHHPANYEVWNDKEYFYPGDSIYFQKFKDNEPQPPEEDDEDDGYAYKGWIRDINQARKIQREYPTAGRRLLTWIRDNLPGPYGADFENKKLEEVATRRGLMANSKWKFANKKKKKIHHKFQTNKSDHQKSVKHYGPLKTHNVRNFKKKSALNEDQSKEIFSGDNQFLYHSIDHGGGNDNDQEDTLASIFNSGILPRTETGNASYGGWLESRPDHVYLGTKDKYGVSYIKPQLMIDMSMIDPTMIKPDEDHAFKSIRKTSDEDLAKMGVEWPEGNSKYQSLGQWMDEHGHVFDTHNNVKDSVDKESSIAVKGGVPADAVFFSNQHIENKIEEINGSIQNTVNKIMDSSISPIYKTNYNRVFKENSEEFIRQLEFILEFKDRIHNPELINKIQDLIQKMNDINIQIGNTKNSNWKFADNKMYRQHTDGPPAAETIFISGPDMPKNSEEDDEIKIINGKPWKIIRPKNNPQPSYYDTLPAGMKNSKKHTHLDTNGNPCTCGFTSHLNLDKESKWKIAGPKLDWIKERGDKALQTEEGQQVLKYLEKNVSEKADPLIPWIVREYKKKRLALHFYESITAYGTERTDLIGFYIPGTDLLLEGVELDHWADWFNDKKSPTRRGVDIMQLDATQMKQKIDDWDVELASKMDQETIDQDKGNVIYQFDDPPGWTMRLVASEECDEEGELMGHCVGGYSSQVACGDIFILSLRDQNNRPHATIEARPDGEIVQIQGKQNEQPIDEYKELIANFFDNGFEKFFDVKPVGREFEVHDMGALKKIENGDEYYDEDDQYGYYHVIDPESYGLESSIKIIYPSILRGLEYFEPEDYDDFVYNDYEFENPINASHRGDAEFIYNVAKSRGEIPQLADAFRAEKENGKLDRHFKSLEKILPDYGDPKSRQKFEQATGQEPHEWDYDEKDLSKVLEQHKRREEYDSAWNDWIRQNYFNPEISWPELRTTDTDNYDLRQIERSGVANKYQDFRPYATMHSLEHLLGQHMYNRGSTQSNMPEGYGHDIIHPLDQENPNDLSPYAKLKHPDFSEQLAEKLLVDAPNREQDFIHPDQQQLFNPDRLTPIEASIKRLKTRIANEYEQDALSVNQLGHQVHSLRGIIGKFLTGQIDYLIKDAFTLIDQTMINNNLDYLPAIKEKIQDIQTEISTLKKDAENDLLKNSSVIKEAPARSKAQYRYMQGICNGSIKPPEGMTRAKACEYVKNQDNYKELPEKASVWKVANPNLVPPEAVRAAARRGIEYHAQGKAGDGFEEATLDRAHKIANGEELTPEHVRRMHSFFERHAGGRSEDAGDKVTPWDVAWLAWGGNAGRAWARQKDAELDRWEKGQKKNSKDCGCWDGYCRVPGTTSCEPGSCEKCDAARKESKWKFSKEQIWEIVLHGTEGYDIIGTGSFEECRKKTEEWLKDFIGGYINYNTEDDAYPIPKDAREQDKIALEELKKAEDAGRWSFYFDYDKPFDLIIQPFEKKKESKWKISAREPYKPVIKPDLSPLKPGQKLTIPEWWARHWEWRQLDRAYKQRQKEYKQERKQKEKQQQQEQQQQVQNLMSGKQSKWKIADYQGWTNWETWNTNLMMQNEYDLYKHFHNLAATGASLNQFVADAIGLIVGPYNQQLQKDFSEISDDEEVEMKKEHQKEEWWTKAEQAHPDDYLAQEEFVRKMEELTYSLMGEPEPTDIANHWLDESKINWQEIYNGWKGNAEAEGNQVMSKWKKISATPFVMQVLEMHDNKYSVDQIAKTLNTSPREVKRIIQSDLRQRPYEGLDISQQYEKALMHKDEQKIKEIENKIWEESDRYNSYDESTDRLKLLQEAMKRNDRGKEHELMKQFWSEHGMGDEYEQDVMNIKQPTQQELNTWMQEELNKIPKQ